MASENLQHPLLPGEPGDHPGFDGGEVGVYKDLPRSRHQRCPDKLGEGVRDIAVEEPQRLFLPPLDQFPGQRHRREVGPGEVLHLDEPAGPAPGTVRTVKLEKPPRPAVLSHCPLHRLVFGGGGLPQLLPELQHPGRLFISDPGRQQPGDRILLQILRRLALRQLALQPGKKLGAAAGIHKPGQPLCLLGEPPLDLPVNPECPVDQLPVEGDPAGVDQKVGLPLLLDKIRNREGGETPPDLHFGHDVLPVIFGKERPFVRIVPGETPVPRFIRDAEVLDERLPCRHLPLVIRKAQHFPQRRQPRRITEVEPVEHRVPPLGNRQLPPQVPAEAVPLEGGVVGVLAVAVVHKGGGEPFRQLIAARQVDHLHRTAVQAVAEEQDGEIRRLGVFIEPAFAEVDARIGLEVDV